MAEEVSTEVGSTGENDSNSISHFDRLLETCINDPGIISQADDIISATVIGTVTSYSLKSNGSPKTTGSEQNSLFIFSDTNMIKYRNKFLEIIEELRIRRELNRQNEKKIHELVSLKHKLEQNLEEQQQKLSELVESHLRQESDIQRKYHDQMRQLEEEKIKLTCCNEGKEKEFQTLKDEIRALHMTKYTLEKKLGEQEHTLQVLTSSRDNYHRQLSQIEQQCITIDRQMTEITEQIDTLENNVKEAMALNQKLQYINSHQECLINEYKENLSKCYKELTEAKVMISTISKEDHCLNDKGRNTEQEIKIQKEVVHQLETQLTQLREEHCSVLQSLKEAHQLIDKHTNLKEEVGELKKQLEHLQQELTLKDDQCNSLEKKLENDNKQHEVLDLTQRLKSLQQDYCSLQISHELLEEKFALLQEEKVKENNIMEEIRNELSLQKIESENNLLKLAQFEKEEAEMITRLSEMQQSLELAEKLTKISAKKEDQVDEKEVSYNDTTENNNKSPMIDLSNHEEECVIIAGPDNITPKRLRTKRSSQQNEEEMTSSLQLKKSRACDNSPDLIPTTEPIPEIALSEKESQQLPTDVNNRESHILLPTECNSNPSSLMSSDPIECNLNNPADVTCEAHIITLNESEDGNTLNTKPSQYESEPISTNTVTKIEDSTNSISITDTESGKLVPETESESKVASKSGIDFSVSEGEVKVAHKDTDLINDLAVMLSDEDVDEEFMDTQLCHQINRVQSFLQKDRLKRTRLPTDDKD